MGISDLLHPPVYFELFSTLQAIFRNMLDKPQNELSEPTFLLQDFKGGAWCPARPIQEGVEEWLEVDLARQHVVTATETMGRYVGMD